MSTPDTLASEVDYTDPEVRNTVGQRFTELVSRLGGITYDITTVSTGLLPIDSVVFTMSEYSVPEARIGMSVMGKDIMQIFVDSPDRDCGYTFGINESDIDESNQSAQAAIAKAADKLCTELTKLEIEGHIIPRPALVETEL